MERIWNLQELQSNPDWEIDELGDWFNSNYEWKILPTMVGQPVQWCKYNGYIVSDEMIAKTEHVCKTYVNADWTKLKCECGKEIIPEHLKEKEALQEANNKLKERLDKGEIGITLENGTILKVGEKIRLSKWSDDAYSTVIAFGEKKMITKFFTGFEELEDIHDNWLPYDPKEEPKPLEGYQKFYVEHENGIIEVCYSKHKPIPPHSMVYTEQEAIDLGLKL